MANITHQQILPSKIYKKAGVINKKHNTSPIHFRKINNLFIDSPHIFLITISPENLLTVILMPK